jgi:DNA-binding NarL/FixJ family response regulator
MIPDSGEDLTQQQLAVLCLFIKGFDLEAIGRQLGIRTLTAEFHLLSLQQKLGLSTRNALIQFAKANNLCC